MSERQQRKQGIKGLIHMDEWKKKNDILRQRRERAMAGGGPDRIARQHSSGKLTARERMEALFDDDTFTEFDDMITSRATDFGMDDKKRPGDGVIAG